MFPDIIKLRQKIKFIRLWIASEADINVKGDKLFKEIFAIINEIELELKSKRT